MGNATVMPITWILVAHESGARLFENSGPGKGLHLRKTIEHPEGRTRDGDVDADRPGRSYGKVGSVRHAMSRERSPHDQAVAAFARELADMLKDGRTSDAYKRLVLVASPRFLGVLRGVIDGPTSALVVGSLDKDLAAHDEKQLAQQLGDIIAV